MVLERPEFILNSEAESDGQGGNFGSRGHLLIACEVHLAFVDWL